MPQILENKYTQNFLSKYKVIIVGSIMSILTAISPLLLQREWNFKSLIVAGCIAAATYIGREARGKNWTMMGQIGAALIAFSSAYEADLDMPRIVISVLIAFFSIPIPPMKLSTYESAAPILEAKEEAIEIKEIRNQNDKSTNTTN